ncbi:enoyl-CoA hydratase [Kutzneria sp. 744]|nr:enoyl-CoA hydratase [Kutzneria sp. 744]
MASYQHILLDRAGATARITMNRPSRRNSLSEDHLRELLDAVRSVAASDATGLVLAAAGPVFSAGHDFGDVASRDLLGVRDLLTVCTSLMQALQSAPQVVIARVHGLATAAGCQLVASCDLAVAASSAAFALPGGHGGWFCHTPSVPVARAIGRKRLMEMALTGDPSRRRHCVGVGSGQPRRAGRLARCRGGGAAGPGDAGEPGVEGPGQADPVRPAGPPRGRRLRPGPGGHGRRLPARRRP